MATFAARLPNETCLTSMIHARGITIKFTVIPMLGLAVPVAGAGVTGDR